MRTAAAAAFAGASGHGRAVGILDGRGRVPDGALNAARAAGIVREKRPADREGADARLKHIVIDKVYFPKTGRMPASRPFTAGSTVTSSRATCSCSAPLNTTPTAWPGAKPSAAPLHVQVGGRGSRGDSIRAAMQSLSRISSRSHRRVKLNSLGRDPGR